VNTWRDDSQAVIARVKRNNPHATTEELKKLLYDAYPFGERKYWPYKVWCQCVRETLGLSRYRPKETPPLTDLPLFDTAELTAELH